MHAPGDDRFSAGLRACTADLGQIIGGDLDRPVPTCPGWTFRQLATPPRPRPPVGGADRGDPRDRARADARGSRREASGGPGPARPLAECGRGPGDRGRRGCWQRSGVDDDRYAPGQLLGASPGPRGRRAPGRRPARCRAGRRSGPGPCRGRRRRMAGPHRRWPGRPGTGTARRRPEPALPRHRSRPVRHRRVAGHADPVPASPSSTATAKPTSPSADPPLTCSLY